MKYKHTFIDLFGTPGGLSLGFEMAGFKSLAVIDNDKWGTKTYVKNFPHTAVIEEDIRSKNTEHPIKSLGGIDIVIGGPPCEGFSVVGRVKIASLAKKGVWSLAITDQRFIDDPRNMLYKEFVKIVKHVKPKFFVMENVPGMMSYRDGQIVQEIMQDFKSIGYANTDVKMLSAELYGVPQKRKRLFFIGNRLGLQNSFPEPSHHDPQKTKINSIHNGKANVLTVWDAISDLPRLKAGTGKQEMHYRNGWFTEYQKWAREGFRQRSELVRNHLARPHSERDVKTFKLLGKFRQWKFLPRYAKDWYGYRDDAFDDKMKRLYRNRPAWTVQSHLYKDGYVYIHPSQNRTITVREAARLQSFPDDFIFEGPRSAQFHQVGRAVPPLLAKAIALEIKKMLNLI